MEPQELVRLQAYMRKVYGAKTLSVRARPKVKDSAEVYIGEEFIGTLTRDEDDDGYQFQMAILDMDLEDV